DDGSYPIPRRQCGGSKLVNDLGVIELSSDDSGIEDSKLISNAASPAKIFGGHSKQEAYYLSDERGLMLWSSQDDILIIPSDIKQSTSSSSARTVSRRLQKSRVRESDGLFRSLTRINDDEVALWQEHQKASLANDERLARQLAEEYDAELADMIVNPEDERLARSLAKQEEERFDQLIKSIEAKKEGIVFSVAVDAVSETLEDGSPAHPDDLERFRPWKQLFERSGMKVKKFHWFVNYELEKRFEQAREKLQRIMGEPPRELQLFHGTSSANVNSILQGGFRIGGVNGQHVVNGAAMGCGIYLAADATTSFSYTMGDNKMFACRVVPGRTSYQINPKPPRSIEVGTESFECYTNGILFQFLGYAVRLARCSEHEGRVGSTDALGETWSSGAPVPWCGAATSTHS
ncbi:hypothetical protein H0H93_008748, partial [Arthromyces matolae]